MKKLIFAFMLISTISIYNSATLKAQDSTSIQKVNLDVSCDLMSRYVWRGTQFGGNSPSIQPGIELNYKNFTLGTWGAYSTGGVHASQELDIYLSANFVDNMFTAVVTDYYFPSDTANYNYLGYDNKTGHVLEAGLLFNGTEKIPFTFSAYLNFYGNDAPKLGSSPSDSSTFNKNDGIQYSNYFELGYNKTISNIDLSAFLGFTLNNQKAADAKTGFIGESGYYGNGPGLVNIGVTLSKGVKITDSFTLPLSASFVINPDAKRAYLVFGFSF